MAFGDDIIEQGAERAEQKGQQITRLVRQKRKEFRGGFEPQRLQTVANLFLGVRVASVSTLRAGCERPLRSNLTRTQISSA